MAGEKMHPVRGGGEKKGKELSPEELVIVGQKEIEAANQAEQEEQKEQQKENKQSEEPTGETEVSESIKEQLREYYAGLVDDKGRPLLSEATIKKLVNAGVKIDPHEETRKADIKKAQDEAYKNAQREIARTLNGKSINQYLLASQRDMVNLQKEIERLEHAVFSDSALKKMKERHLADARGELLAMDRRRKMIAGLQKGAEIEPVGSSEYGDFDAVSAELDMNQAETNTNNKMTKAAFERILRLDGVKEDREFVERLLKKYKGFLKDAEGRQNSDIEVQSFPEATDKEVAKAAAAEGGSKKSQEQRRGGNNSSGAKKAEKAKVKGNGDRAQKAKSDGSYASRLAELADKNDWNWGDSDETKKAQRRGGEQGAEQGKGAERVKGKNKARGAIKKRMAGALLGLLTAAQVFGGAHSVKAAEMKTTVIDDEDEIKAYKQAELAAEASERGMTMDSLAQERLLDYESVPEQEFWNLGNSYYQGFMEREKSQMMANGLRANFTLYESEKNSPNSYGPSQGYIYNMTEGRQEEAKKKLIEMIRDQPQALASFTSNYPRMLKACGVDESVIYESNLETRAQDIMKLLLGEGGGDLQNKLLGASVFALNNKNTSFDFYLENGMERSFCMERINKNLPNTPDNIRLKTVKVYRDNVPQVQITMRYIDGVVEYSDQNLNCYMQSNMTVNDYSPLDSVIVLITEEDPEPQQEIKEIVQQTVVEQPRNETPEPEEIVIEEKPKEEPPVEYVPPVVDDVPPVEEPPVVEEPPATEQPPVEENPPEVVPPVVEEKPEEIPPVEVVKPKDEAVEQEVVDAGEQNANVVIEPTPEVPTGLTTEEEGTASGDNLERIEDVDLNPNDTGEQMSDDTFLDYVSSFVNSLSDNGLEVDSEQSVDGQQSDQDVQGSQDTTNNAQQQS